MMRVNGRVSFGNWLSEGAPVVMQVEYCGHALTEKRLISASYRSGLNPVRSFGSEC